MLGLSSLFAMNSCGEDFLDVDHYDILQPEIMFTSEDFVNQGLNGLYDTFLPLSTGSEDIEKLEYKTSFGIFQLSGFGLSS